VIFLLAFVFSYTHRSEVFAAMFSMSMKESTENIVRITDTEPHVLELFLRLVKDTKRAARFACSRNNLVQYKLRQCWRATNTFIRVPP